MATHLFFSSSLFIAGAEMFEVFFAFVLTTVLLISFKATRLWGAVALFLLLCVAPILSSLLLIAVAVGCYQLFGKPKWGGPPWKLPRD
jgi:hypothetical protein